MIDPKRKSTPPPIRVALVIYLIKSERETYEALRRGETFPHPDQLKNGARRVVKALLEADLLEKVSGIESVTELYKLKPINGILVRDIAERHNYRLPKDRYDFIRHVQRNFKPNLEAKLLRDSKAQLVEYFDDWKEFTGQGFGLEIGPWIMSGKLSTSPSQGSGIVTFKEGEPIYFVTIPGLEAFDLECVEKEMTRSARKKRSVGDGDDAITRPLRERIEAERERLAQLRDKRAKLQLELEAVERTIAASETQVERFDNALKFLTEQS